MDYRWEAEETDSTEMHGARMAVLEYQALPLETPVEGFFQVLERPRRFRQLRLNLTDGEAVMQPGALQWSQGDIELEAVRTAGQGARGLVRSAVSAAGTSDGMFKTLYHGSGRVHSELSRQYLLLGEFHGGLIVDDGAFLAAGGNFQLDIHFNAGLAKMLGSGSGLVQPRVEGDGVFCLQSPVHPSEVQVLDLQGDTLKVDGNLVLAYTDSLNFNVERTSRSIIGSARTGEGFVQTYTGSGRVWIAPTRFGVPTP